MSAYVRGFIVLFVLLALLLHLPPGKSMKRYIHFFAGLILTMGLLAPVLSLLFDSEEFLTLIRYEEFAEEIAGISRDMDRIEYVGQDYRIAQYESAIAEDVTQLAAQYGCPVQGARVRLTESYEVAGIELWIGDGDGNSRGSGASGEENPGESGASGEERESMEAVPGGIVIGEIVLGDGESKAAGDGGPVSGNGARESGRLREEYGDLIREISAYYRVDPSLVQIW